MDRPTGVAVWGLGPHAQGKIVPALVACAGTRLVGVTTRDVAVGAAVAASARCAHYAEPDAMLADPAVEVVYVATPIGLHFEHAARALAAGKHVWCEKALTESGARSRALVGRGRAAGLAVVEAFMHRYHPQFARVRALTGGGELGAVRSLTVRFGLPTLERPGFRHDPALGGGALGDVGCYAVSVALDLLGPDLTLTAGTLGQRGGRAVDTDGLVVLAAPSGARAVLEWGYDVAYRNELFVWGERGALAADRIFSKPATLATEVVVYDERGQARREPTGAADSFVRMFEALSAAVHDPVARERRWRRAEVQADLMARLEALRPGA